MLFLFENIFLTFQALNKLKGSINALPVTVIPKEITLRSPYAYKLFFLNWNEKTRSFSRFKHVADRNKGVR